MKVWVVLRADAGEDACRELVGAFTDQTKADTAASGTPGRYVIAEIDTDMVYSDQPLNTFVKTVLAGASLLPSSARH